MDYFCHQYTTLGELDKADALNMIYSATIGHFDIPKASDQFSFFTHYMSNIRTPQNVRINIFDKLSIKLALFMRVIDELNMDRKAILTCHSRLDARAIIFKTTADYYAYLTASPTDINELHYRRVKLFVKQVNPVESYYQDRSMYNSVPLEGCLYKPEVYNEFGALLTVISHLNLAFGLPAAHTLEINYSQLRFRLTLTPTIINKINSTGVVAQLHRLDEDDDKYVGGVTVNYGYKGRKDNTFSGVVTQQVYPTIYANSRETALLNTIGGIAGTIGTNCTVDRHMKRSTQRVYSIR